jgi:hypothetical protein
MNHYIDFNPYRIREHNQQIHTEVNSLRLQEQQRKNRKVRSSSRLFALVKCGRLKVLKASSLRSILVDATIGRPISPGRRLRTTSQESFVQESPAGGGKMLWTLRSVIFLRVIVDKEGRTP